MPVALQRSCGCIIGEDYPAPIVDHATQRVRALELYKAVRAAATDTQTWIERVSRADLV
jgi:deoxyribodipyrimidine photo-lyase